MLDMAHLKQLDLRRMSLSTMPDFLSHCPKLETLLLGDNGLRALPQDIGASCSLRHLYLGSNQLVELPLDLLQLWPSLTTLHLGANAIRSFPFHEDDFPALIRGSIGINPISEPVGSRWMLRRDAVMAAQRVLECFKRAEMQGGDSNHRVDCPARY